MASPRSSSDRLTSREVEQEFEGICELQLGQVLWLCEYLLLNKCSSAVTPDPTILLEALYQRCWGRDWKSEAESLLDAGSRSVVDDTMALLSAFLYEHILIRKHEDGLAGATAAAPAQLEALYGELLSTLESMRMDNLAAQLSAALCPYFSGLAQMSVLVHARSPKDLRDPLSQ